MAAIVVCYSESNKIMRAYINGIGLSAPGMEGLSASESVLGGEVDWQFHSLPKLVVDMLPANERRRTTQIIKLALQTAKSALDDAGTGTDNLASVFASSDGDFEIVHKLCEALCEEEKAVSPTLFHNSVHNAPAGYWAIAADSHAPSTSISAADASFTAGLLESVTQIATKNTDVLLVSYDYPPPAPLDIKRAITMPFGMAFLLSSHSTDTTRACLHIERDHCINSSKKTSACQNSSLEVLRNANPAARGLPLLESIFRKQSVEIVLPYVANNNLVLKIQP